MMKINVAQISQEVGARQSFHFHCSVAVLNDNDHCWLDGEITVHGEAVNIGGTLRIDGTIGAIANQDCHRCLKQIEKPVIIPFTENYRDVTNSVARKDESVFSGDEIEIDNLVRESMLVAEPIKFLCSETCRGLCPECGTDLNESSCACDQIKIDPRLLALQKLLEKI